MVDAEQELERACIKAVKAEADRAMVKRLRKAIRRAKIRKFFTGGWLCGRYT